MATEKQREANRKNAARSTGPKTDEGKAQSRFNALKHGIRATNLDVLPNEDPAEYQARINAWFEHYEPTDVIEEQTVRHAVHISWKIDRTERYETAHLSAMVRDAMACAERARSDRFTHACLELLPQARGVERSGLDPAGANWLRLEVETTAVGCQWLIGIWQSLRESALAHQAWTPEQELHAIRLIGLGPDTIYDSNTIDIVIANRMVSDPKFPLSAENWNDGTLQTKFDKSSIRAAFARKPADPTAAFAIMVAAADRAIACLEDVLAERVRNGDLGAEDVEMAGALASFDPSMESERLRRYQVSLHRELTRTLDSLAKHRREKAREAKQESIGANKADSEGLNAGRAVHALAETSACTAETSACTARPRKGITDTQAPNEANSAVGVRVSSSLVANRPFGLLEKGQPVGLTITDLLEISCLKS